MIDLSDVGLSHCGSRFSSHRGPGKAAAAGVGLLLAGAALALPAHAKMEDVEIGLEPLRDGVYLLTDRGGNLGLSVGEDATFLIDDQFAPLTEKISAAIATLIIPGHGPLGSRDDLQRFHDMMVEIRARVARRMAAGESLERIQAARPTADFDKKVNADGFINPDVLVGFIYECLKDG